MKMRKLLCAAIVSAAATLLAAPEITWSVMHPTAVNPAYMRRVVDMAAKYGGVDSFEVCGNCHSAYGGLDGLSTLDPYPHAHALIDDAAVKKARADLNAVVDMAHGAGKKLYYWHREVYIPKGLLEDIPHLMDENGEFDLLGDAYLGYLRFKLSEAFRYVPGLDGIVLTLTEADYSVIHSAHPDRYPPRKVVETLVSLFADEHAKRGKRFVLRSFGSIRKDYEDIIAGAVAAARRHGFEIETKVTEADFVPWLPKNPFLKKNPPLTLGAECDALGEYLGAGYLPAAQVERIGEYVASAREEGVDRYVIRIDRVGNSIFDSAHEVNLYAYMRFIRDPSATADGIRAEYAASHYGPAAAEMAELEKGELDMVRDIHYVASNLVFHSFPIKPDFKYVKAGGSFALYREGRDLSMSRGIWSILNWMRTPSHAQILAEKERGAAAAMAGLAKVESMKGKLPKAEYERQVRAWSTAVKAARALKAYTSCVVAYFEDMEARRDEPSGLLSASAAAVSEIESMMNDPNDRFTGRGEHFNVSGGNLDRVYFVGLRHFCRALVDEYRAERAMRRELEGRDDVLDFVVVGGIYDDVRVGRSSMHAAHARLSNGRVVRIAGNDVFPNGTMRVEFRDVPGARVEVSVDPEGHQGFTCSESVSGGVRTVTVGRRGDGYPAIRYIALVSVPTP